MQKFLFLFILGFAWASEVPDFTNLENTNGAVIFLSIERSGSNLISASLSIITRKPISWLCWKNRVFENNARCKTSPSYNRLSLPLVTDQPLFYRTHREWRKLKQIPSDKNRLIFVTRNPKELLFRKLFVEHPEQNVPDNSFMEEFLNHYLHIFNIYEMWDPNMRAIIFYEDFIRSSDAILLELLSFMGEEPVFFTDYQLNKKEYLSRLLSSYSNQHRKKLGGNSSRKGPQQIYYTKDAPKETLIEIDDYLKRKAPILWEKYLNRFQTDL